MEDIVRVGILSSADPDTGTARVYYPDRGCTTAPLHLFSFHGEYAIPKVGDQVVVLHLSNDISTGVILGRFWGQAEKPPTGLPYYKQVDEKTYTALRDGVYTLHGDEIRLEGKAGGFTVSEYLELEKRVAALERRS